jgi:DNA adenine methylase
MTKPILKWAGGKRSIIDKIEHKIKEVVKKDSTFFDLFTGSGTVVFYLEKHFSKVVMNDANDELINLYDNVRSNVEAIIKLLEKLKKNHSKEQYYQVRAWDRKSDFRQDYSSFELAARTIYLNRTCFNGLYRVNSKGQFNVPMGRYKNPRINDFDNLRSVSKLLNSGKILIKNSDFTHLKKMIKAGDVVYLDPPYDKETDSSFVDYTNKSFDKYDQERLKDFFDELTLMGVYVILSNSATERIRDLYNEYINEDSYIEVNRSVGASSKTRIKAKEILIDNFRKVNQHENIS